MDQKWIEYHKRMCKIRKKYNNPKNQTLMQIQHEYAKEKGFKNWNEFIENYKKEQK